MLKLFLFIFIFSFNSLFGMDKPYHHIYKEGELFIQITKKTPVKSSIKGYLKEIFVLQVIHRRPCINQLIKGIFSRQDNCVLHLGQKLLGVIIDKLLGKR